MFVIRMNMITFAAKTNDLSIICHVLSFSFSPCHLRLSVFRDVPF